MAFMAGRGDKTGATWHAVILTAPLLIGMLVSFLTSSFSQTSGTPRAKGVSPVGEEKPALSTVLNGPSAMAYSSGQIYVMETAGTGIWSLDTVRQTAILILAPTTQPYTDDKTILGSPFALAVSYNGDVFVGDVGGKLAQIKQDTHSALVKRAGLLEKFPQIHAMAADPRDGTIVLTDRHALLRWAPETNELVRLGGSYYGPGFSGDGGPVAVDSHGTLFLSEGCRVRRIDAEGIITTYAGTGVCGFSGDGELATNAMVNADGLAVGDNGNLYISDYRHNRIRCVDGRSRRISTFAGNGAPHRVDVLM
jgi:hypothetical protein